MTAITATPAGEGKTVTTIGLVQALGRLNKRVMGAIREPSLGPTFGLKGGATGGGYSQVYPMWDIDLHFTGDIHAVGAANNLLSAILENSISKKNELNIDPTRIVLRKAMDMNCRELRHIVVGLGGRTEGGTPHESGFIITVATEISAILALATSMADLKERLGKMIVAYTYEGEPVTVTQLGCVGALALLLKDAIFPNLVQTLEGEPFFIHGFPFANIAHGNSSVTATKYALKMADIVVTEAGFAADLGAEKFFDIVCRNEGIHADCAVIVCSIRALKMHGSVSRGQGVRAGLRGPEAGLLQPGQAHREHPQVRRAYGRGAEPLRLRHRGGDPHRHRPLPRARASGAPYRTSSPREGRAGRNWRSRCWRCWTTSAPISVSCTIPKLPLKEKIRIVATEMYGALDVQYESGAEKAIKLIETSGTNRLPVCMAKTQLSLSDNPKLKGAPTGWVLNVREVFVSAGAGFIVVVCGPMMLMPGLSSEPAALGIDISDEGYITGLY